MTPDEKAYILKKCEELQKGTFTDHCGMRFSLTEQGEPEFTLEIRSCHSNPNRTVHGGMLFTLIDSAVGFTARMDQDFKGRVVTQNASIHYLRPALSGLLRTKVRPVHVGHRTGLYHADVLDDRGRVVCCGEVTVFYLRDEPDI